MRNELVFFALVTSGQDIDSCDCELTDIQLDCKMVLDTVSNETTQRWDQLASRDANPLGRTLTVPWFILRSRSCCHFWPVGSEAQWQGDLLTK